jgi:DTW domain-containing protein YfiP
MSDKQTRIPQGRGHTDRSGFRQICLRCMRPEKHCLCAVIHPFDTVTQFVILIHPKEVKKVRNGTGRLAHLSLLNSRLIMGESFLEDPEVAAILDDGDREAVLLYPGESSAPAAEFRFSSGKKPVVFVFDGTWSGARKMMRLSKNLHHLPRIKITPRTPSRFLIRVQPNPQCLSTIESIHALLEIWNARGIERTGGRHHNLIRVLDELVHTQLGYIGDPGLEAHRRRHPAAGSPKPRSRKRHKIFPYFRE